MKIAVYNNKGEKTKDLDVKSGVLDVAAKPLVLREVVLAFLAAGRCAHAKTKKRGEISGGGRKPWRQKGTGRARTGSIRNPIWRGGGNIFGPTGIENFTKKVNIKVKKQSLLMALSTKEASKAIIVLEGADFKKPSTKGVVAILNKLPEAKSRLVVMSEAGEALIKSFRNIAGVETIDYKNLNTYEVLKASQIIFVEDALDKTLEYFGKKESIKNKKDKEKEVVAS